MCYITQWKKCRRRVFIPPRMRYTAVCSTFNRPAFIPVESRDDISSLISPAPGT